MNKYHFFVVYICVSRDRLLKFPWRHLVLISLAMLKKTHKQLLFGDKIRKTLDEWKDNSVLARFGATHERDGRTDGRTPGDSIYRAYA